MKGTNGQPKGKLMQNGLQPTSSETAMKGHLDMSRTGRPKSENPRTKRVVIRFTEDEYTALEFHSGEKSLSEFIRGKIL